MILGDWASISVCKSIVISFYRIREYLVAIRIYSAIILKIVYDMDVNDMDHKYVQIVEEVVTTLSVAQVPGKFWVEFVPILRHIPSWVPGAYFKRWAERVRPVVNQMINLPFDDVKENMVCGLWMSINFFWFKFDYL